MLVCLAMTMTLTGCVTTFTEDHYFQSRSGRSDQATNYFRVRVDGYSAFSRARYIAGYYDERAVDLFFNEIKTGEPAKLFEQDVTEPGTAEKIRPLSPEDKHGTLVMVLSTNAKAVTDAIGQFGENQLVADAVTNLVNRREVIEARRAAAKVGPQVGRARSVSSELDSLFTAVPAGGAAAETEAAYVRILNTLAAALGASESFTSIKDAERWFRAALATGGQP